MFQSVIQIIRIALIVEIFKLQVLCSKREFRCQLLDVDPAKICDQLSQLLLHA